MSAAPKLAAVPPQPMDTFEGLIRSREAARLLGRSEWRIRQMAHNGELPYIQETDRSPMYFDPPDLRRWIEKEKIRGNGNGQK